MLLTAPDPDMHIFALIAVPARRLRRRNAGLCSFQSNRLGVGDPWPLPSNRISYVQKSSQALELSVTLDTSLQNPLTPIQIP
jgi:hypothetical protein